MTGDEGRDRALELGGLPTEVADLGQERPGELSPDASRTSEGTLDRLELAATDELSDRPAIAGQQDHQVGVEAVAGLGLGTDEIIARIGQQAELSRAILEPDRRQLGLP
jgi:hypothetical protein